MGITLGAALMLLAAVVAWLAHGRINGLIARVKAAEFQTEALAVVVNAKNRDARKMQQDITALNDRLTRYADELEAVSKTAQSAKLLAGEHSHNYAPADRVIRLEDDYRLLNGLVNNLPRDLMKHASESFAPLDHTHPEFAIEPPPPPPDPVDIPAIVQAALTTALAPFTPRHATDVTASNPDAINLDLTPAERAERDQEQLIAAYDAYDPTDDEFPLGRAYDDYTPPVIPGVEINLPTL